jgi:hypothetical protein
MTRHSTPATQLPKLFPLELGPVRGNITSVVQEERSYLCTSEGEFAADLAGGVAMPIFNEDVIVEKRIFTGDNMDTAGAVTFYPPDGFAWFHLDNGPDGGRSQGRLRISHGGHPGEHEIINILQNGTVGIGTSAPQATLHVEGNVMVSGDIVLQNADCAEEFDIAVNEDADPGTVMVLDDSGYLRASVKSYDRKVAGVVAGAGDLRPGLILGRRPGKTDRVPIALLGKTYCKVDAQFAPIAVGDLLTTSSTIGHAMRASDPAQAFGSIIGKALGPLPSGTGSIPILVALQ